MAHSTQVVVSLTITGSLYKFSVITLVWLHLPWPPRRVAVLPEVINVDEWTAHREHVPEKLKMLSCDQQIYIQASIKLEYAHLA